MIFRWTVMRHFLTSCYSSLIMLSACHNTGLSMRSWDYPISLAVGQTMSSWLCPVMSFSILNWLLVIVLFSHCFLSGLTTDTVKNLIVLNLGGVRDDWACKFVNDPQSALIMVEWCAKYQFARSWFHSLSVTSEAMIVFRACKYVAHLLRIIAFLAILHLETWNYKIWLKILTFIVFKF